ncbi:MAG: phosphoglucomutase [Tenericutes bacterium HGW-Tenericutes-6]|jgi:phosphoglucomutase|nr:MAG: phosphoglucomutase [Tenericutes bacterium HGW-Tenericutes-6]
MSYEKKYQFWLNQKDLDPVLLDELINLNEEQIEEVFYSDLSFGTGGLRGLMGVGTNRVNVYTIRKATLGFARFLKKKGIPGGVAISYDNRHYSESFAKEAAMVLAAEGIDSYLFESLRPTPMLSFAVRHFKACGGIMITASHNPKTYNGYKAYDHTGAQLNLEDAEKVIEEINHIDNPFMIDILDNERIHYIKKDFDEIYLNEVKKIKINDVKKDLKIVYSPLHGTGKDIIPGFLKAEGYQILPYEPQMVIDPNFSQTKSSNPEEKEAYEKTIDYAHRNDAGLVMITDPDADRLGIAVKHQGEFHLLTGNQTAAIELFYILSEKKLQNKLPKKGFVYTTNVTTDLIKVIAKDFDMEVVTTLTGFKFIGEKAEKNKHLGTYVFGCEESYGSLVKDFVRDKDAVQAVYLLSEIANYLNEQGQTLMDYLHHIYQIYGFYYEYTNSITLLGLSGLEKMKTLMQHFKKHPPVVLNKRMIAFDDLDKGVHVEDGITSKVDLPKSNVLKYYYEDNTWIVFRPSGTEPKIKIYFGTKGKSMEDAKAFIHALSDQIALEIEGL